MPGERSVLVTGAGIAGPALAFWLHRYGVQVTVVERADRLPTAGQNIDVRGAGREVTRRMGIEQQIADAGTGEAGTRFVDDQGRSIAEFPAGTGDSDGATAELEIIRGQLTQLLVDLTAPDDVQFVYGDHVTAIEQDDAGATVTFAEGEPRSFDLVLIAEGIRSQTRELVFGHEAHVRDLGQYIAYASIPRTGDDDQWWRWYSAAGGRAVNLRPDNVGTTRAMLSFMSPPKDYERLDAAGQLEVLQRTFADVGWEAPRILRALTPGSADLYLDRTAQIQAPSWSRGRVALTGDAAYCASPVSGMGTSLALTGAYVLAGEIASNPDHRAAFRRYEERMRPYVEKAQKLPPGTPRIANPKSRLGVQVFRTALRLAASRPASALGSRFFTPPAEDFTLPDYATSISP